MNQHEVIIIGAGMAGLACAKYLLDKNIQPLVLEASDAVGGRVRTDKVDGFLLDRGFQILLTAYPEAQRLLNYDALNLKNFRSGALIRTEQNDFAIMTDPFKEPLQLFNTLFSSVGSFKDKLKILQFSAEVSKDDSSVVFQKTDIDTLAYLHRYGWSNDMIAKFFKPFLGGVFLDNELITSSNFFRFVFKQFYNGEASIPSSGMQAIPQQVADRIGTDKIWLNTYIEKVEGNKVYLENGEVLTASKIVIATDAHNADKLLNRNQKRHYNITTCTYFVAPRSPLSHKMLAINPNRLSMIHNMCVPSDIAPTYAPAGSTLISISTQGLELFDEEKLTTHLRLELEGWFGAEVNNWRHLRTYHIPEALVTYKADTTHAPIRLADNLYECGDHVAYPSLNAAIATGRKVAKLIAKDIKP